MSFELITQGEQGAIGTGPVAQRLLASGMNIQALRTNATLRKDEWELLDTAVVQVGRDRLRAAADLINRGLVFNVANALGTTVVQHETASAMTAASVSMDGVTQGQNDRVTFNLKSNPLPIIHKDFYLSARVLNASRTLGQTLDTTQAEEASIVVSETIEDLTVNGLSSGGVLGFSTSTATLYGYTTEPNRNTVTLATNWNESAATGADILDDVIAMIQAAHVDRYFGPYVLYVPTLYWVKMLEDFKANSDKTILQRVMEIPDVERVVPIDRLTANNVLLVQMTRNVVDLAVGQMNTTVSWESQGGMLMHFKVMAILVPRPKSDANSGSGIVHLS